MSVTEAVGPTTTSASPAMQERCERALALTHSHRGDPETDVERLLADDPSCVFAHCLRTALVIRGDEAAARPALAASIACIEAIAASDDPARRHANAAHAWLDGDPALALARYGELVADRPHDVLALVVAHALDFRLHRLRMLRDRVARALLSWDAGRPGYGSVLAMYAFGLEENGQYRHAERCARRALAIDPGHPAAIHALVHVMEMRGQAREGLALLASTEAAWRESTFRVHLAWHRALFHLDADDPRSALAAYDDEIAADRGCAIAALADASALLWRLELRDAGVNARWQALADRWQACPLAGVRPFYAVHAMMAFAAATRTAAAERVLETLDDAEASAAWRALPEMALARPLCAALLAFARGRHDDCLAWLARVRRIANRCGGSVAQCDLIHLTFTEAALRARETRLARTLVAERALKKPASLLNRLLQRRVRMMPATT